MWLLYEVNISLLYIRNCLTSTSKSFWILPWFSGKGDGCWVSIIWCCSRWSNATRCCFCDWTWKASESASSNLASCILFMLNPFTVAWFCNCSIAFIFTCSPICCNVTGSNLSLSCKATATATEYNRPKMLTQKGGSECRLIWVHDIYELHQSFYSLQKVNKTIIKDNMHNFLTQNIRNRMKATYGASRSLLKAINFKLFCIALDT